MVQVGVSCASGGQFFRKVDKTSPSGHFNSNFNGWLNQDRAYLLAIEDPKVRAGKRRRGGFTYISNTQDIIICKL